MCYDNTSATHDPNTSTTSCNKDEYFDAESKRCKSCPTGCLECTSPSNCTLCESKYIRFNGKCEKQANCEVPGSSSNSLVSSCQQCPENCASCEKDSGPCTQCNVSFYLSDTRCLPCMDNCIVCYDSFTCSICSPGFTFNNKICEVFVDEIVKTGEDEPSSQTTTSVSPINGSGNGDDGGSSNVPDEFDDGLVRSKLIDCLFEKNGKPDVCFICKDGFYFSLFNFSCAKCPNHCVTCRSEKFCSKCASGYVFSLDKNTNSILCSLKVFKINLFCQFFYIKQTLICL